MRFATCAVMIFVAACGDMNLARYERSSDPSLALEASTNSAQELADAAPHVDPCPFRAALACIEAAAPDSGADAGDTADGSDSDDGAGEASP